MYKCTNTTLYSLHNILIHIYLINFLTNLKVYSNNSPRYYGIYKVSKKPCLQEICSEEDKSTLCNKTQKLSVSYSLFLTSFYYVYNLTLSIPPVLWPFHVSPVRYPFLFYFPPLPPHCMVYHSNTFLTGPNNSHCSFCHTWLANSHTQDQFNNHLCFLSCWVWLEKSQLV